ncbi:MAG: ORF6N domain-containing protein [Pseudomonadota bacterium]
MSSSEDRPAPRLFRVRGQMVILDEDIAAFFGRTTTAVNQNRARRAARFPEDYAFQLTENEWENLMSQIVTSSEDRDRSQIVIGSDAKNADLPEPNPSQIVTGSKASTTKHRSTLPWAYTEHGFVMLAMSFRGEEADRIARVVTDTFVAHRTGTLPRDKVLTGGDAARRRNSLRVKIMDMIDGIAAMPLPTGSTAAEELETSTAKALGRVKAWLDQPKLENAKLDAEIAKLAADTQKAYTEIAKMEAETAQIWADTVLKRLTAVQQLREMAAQIERDDLTDMLEQQFDPSRAIDVSPMPKIDDDS